MLVAGADGCRSGWICVTRDLDTGRIGAACFPDAEALFLLQPRPAVLAIDIPIGLPDAGPRGCDREARRMLGKRGCCVFTAPLRGLLSASSWEEACSIRERIEQKRIPKQVWEILPKIQEVDRLMVSDFAGARGFVREVHPEVSFLARSGQPLRYGKKKRAGKLERIQLIEESFGAQDIARIRSLGDVGTDDVLDAFVALWTAERIVRGDAVSIPASPAKDSLGLAMEIVY